jgi:SAM-dependent methyltransferase
MTTDSADWHPAAIADYWDAVGPRYLALFRNEFDDKPFDQAVLRDFATGLRPGAKVLDAGCGPCGHVARILANEGLDVTGVDISQACIRLARTAEPTLRFEVMDMADLSFPDGHFDGIVAYYALHYHPYSELAGVIRELARVLRYGGQLLLVAKEGSGEGWIDDPMDITGKVFWSAWPADDLQSLVAENGFAEVHCQARSPLKHEIDVRRIYLSAVRS